MRNEAMACNGLSILCLILIGCGQGHNTHEVEGRVLLAGQPLDRIEVIFIPDETAGTVGPRSLAVTDENGFYKLMTEDGKSIGAVAGKHRIVLNDLKAIPLPQNRPNMAGRSGNGSAGQEAPGGGSPALGRPGRLRLESNVGPAADIKTPPSRIPFLYREFSTTPMHQEVQPAKQTIDLELTGR